MLIQMLEIRPTSSNFKMTINTLNASEDSDLEIYRVGNDFMSVRQITVEGYGTQILADYYKYYAGQKHGHIIM